MIGSGGVCPSFADVAGLLDTFAADPTGQLCRLLAVATFTVAIGNADAHGKNLSLLHTAPGVVELAPSGGRDPRRPLRTV